MDTPEWVINQPQWRQDCAEIVRCSEDLVSGRCGVIEAARLLWKLSYRVRAEWDPDFVMFRGIYSESDALPVGPERQRWAAEALKREDAKIASFEAHWRPKAIAAALNLVKKYGA